MDQLTDLERADQGAEPEDGSGEHLASFTAIANKFKSESHIYIDVSMQSKGVEMNNN